MSSVQLAQILWQRLSEKHVWDHKEVVFIAHSLGGLLTEEMLLNHPTEAQHVRFIVSYGTPHQGSFAANLAKIYDDDPLLTDMQESNDNIFLMKLEQQWRGTPTVNRIHRFAPLNPLTLRPEAAWADISAHMSESSVTIAQPSVAIPIHPLKRFWRITSTW
jgi:pimeloyl-ACP methyl ester carboxylesterase